MDFIKKYTSHEKYEVKKTPNVSLCLEDNGTKHMHYTKKRFDDEYLTFEALESGTFTLTIASGVTTGDVASVSYSLDNGETWTATNNVDGQTVTITTPTVNAGDEVLWKGNAVRMSNNNDTNSASTFSSTANFNARGNIMSLLYGDEFKGKVSLNGKDYCFFRLFGTTRKLVNGKNISLPAITLADYCYCYMFGGCTSLATAPELPATTLAENCYQSMFNGCTSLATAPELPALQLTNGCYYSMFQGCTSLTVGPELPATTLVQYCYQYMFSGCTSLTVALELPATTLANGCYQAMFANCKSLTAASELPATTLASNCYSSMFYGCTSLTTAPELPATTLAQYCYDSMFYGCRSLTTAPELPATTLAERCYSYMFQACTNLNSIKMLSVYQYYMTSYLSGWAVFVAAYGKYTMSESCLQLYLQGNKNLRSFIPKGWEVWYVDSNGDEHYVGINDEGGSNPYGYDYSYDYSYGYGYNYGYDYDPLSGNRYPFDFYHDDDNTNTFRITNTGSTTVNSEIYFTKPDENCIFGDYHYGLVYSYDGYIYSDVPYKSTCPTTITIEPDQTIFLKGIMKPYSHGFDIYIGGQNLEIGGNILSIVDPQNMENSIYEGMYTKTDNVYRFDSFDTKYLTVRVLKDDAVITYGNAPQGNVMYYSVDGGTNWDQLSTAVTFSNGTDVMLKMSNPTISSDNGIGNLSFNKYAKVYGNIMSLLYGDNFSGETSLSGKDHAFYKLFANNNRICDTSLLVLPATTLTISCYYEMFRGCTSLTTAPELPATTLTQGCYAYMFQGCTSLTTAPELPATTLANSCYNGMFDGCTSLATAPKLPATTLTSLCYRYMFRGCTNLTIAPELPATTLTISCYCEMFYGCTSIVTAPELPATTLAEQCYQSMFYGCTSLNYIKAMFTTIPSGTYTQNWVRGVAPSGTFVKNAAATWDVTGVNGIPTGWTVKTAS